MRKAPNLHAIKIAVVETENHREGVGRKRNLANKVASAVAAIRRRDNKASTPRLPISEEAKNTEDHDRKDELRKCGGLRHTFQVTRGKSPNDLKLSDGGAWRGSCVVERRKRQRASDNATLGRDGCELEIAATVTRGAVRCSAWLGVAVVWN